MVITERQLDERAGYIGASDVAKIIGLARFGTPLSVFMAKVYPNRDDGELRIGGKMEAAYWGTKLEDKVCEGFTEATGKKVNRVNETVVHGSIPYFCANLDRRVVGEDAVLEAKTVTAFKAKEWEGDEMPEEYIVQVMSQLAVTGKKYGYLACLIGGQRLVHKVIERDEEMIARIEAAVKEFWNQYVLPKQPPMATGSDRDGSLLNRLYPEAEANKAIELPGPFEAILVRREELGKMIDDLEEQLQEAENQVKAEMKDAEAATAGRYYVTWKNQKRLGIDSKHLAEKFPDVYAQVSRATTFRALRVRENKKGGE